MKKPFRKALDPKSGCASCGHFIGLRVNGGYRCDHCGHQVKPRILAHPNCLCWVHRELCTLHSTK